MFNTTNPFAAWQDLTPEMAKMWGTDPMAATRKWVDMQKAALDTLQENTEQAINLYKKALDNYVATVEAMTPKKPQA